MSGISRIQSARDVQAFGGRGRVYAVYASTACSREGNRDRARGSFSMSAGVPNPVGSCQPAGTPPAAA